MKKSYLTLAAVAAIMASCTNEVLIDPVETPEVAIGFETFNNKATKAENSTETNQLGLLAHHSTFSVWGYKDVQTTYVFGTSTTAGQKVSGTAGTPAVLYTYEEYKALEGNSGVTQVQFDALTDAEKTKTQATADKWSYSPVRFWDKNSNSYEFYAAAPETTAEPKWILNANDVDNQSDDYFTLGTTEKPVSLVDATLTSTSFVESMKGQTNTDYMIASPKNVANASYSQTVQLDFNHILSRLNITVKKGPKLADIAATYPADAKLNIVDIEVRDMISKGTFDEKGATVGNTAAAATYGRWTRTTDKVTYNACVADASDVTETPIYVLQSLIIPQPAAYQAINRDGSSTETAPYIYIEYQIGTTTGTVSAETYKAYINLAAAFGKSTGEVAFNEGWQNTLNLTIDVDAIEFDPQVYKWDNGDSKDFPIE